MKKILRKVKRTLDKILGTSMDELYWSFRHLFDKRWADVYMSQKSINHPHRKLLINKISESYPFQTLLEVGCASGPNLFLLSKKFPELKIYGIDISKKAVETGKRWFKKRNINNVTLFVGRAENLKKILGKSIDVVFADASLIYLGPDKIGQVISELFRVAKKTVILNELHTDCPESFYVDHWVHNYKLLFSKLASLSDIKFIKIDPGVWGGDWGKYGNIIEVKIKK